MIVFTTVIGSGNRSTNVAEFLRNVKVSFLWLSKIVGWCSMEAAGIRKFSMTFTFSMPKHSHGSTLINFLKRVVSLQKGKTERWSQFKIRFICLAVRTNSKSTATICTKSVWSTSILKREEKRHLLRWSCSNAKASQHLDLLTLHSSIKIHTSWFCVAKPSVKQLKNRQSLETCGHFVQLL